MFWAIKIYVAKLCREINDWQIDSQGHYCSDFGILEYLGFMQMN